MRKSVFLLLIITLSGITACAPQSDCFSEDVFCAALVTDTRGINDLGINQNTWAGLTESKAQGIVDQIANIESVDPRDYEKNIAFFVNAGYDVIFTSGIGLQNASLRSADLYPDTVFIGMNQADEESVPNFISVTFPEDQMGFLAGVLAVRLTRTNIVGGICETSGIDSMWRYCEGFRAGAKYADESVRIFVLYRDNQSSDKLFNDAEWGAESARTLIGEGADILFAVGGETGTSALRTAAEAGILIIGAERDQGAVLGEKGSSVAASFLGEASFTVQDLMRQIKGGNLADSPSSPIRFLALNSVIPKSVIEELNDILAGLAGGELKINIPFEKP